MPKSRKRRPRKHPSRKPEPGRRLIAKLRPGQSLEHLVTPDDEAERELEMDAAARGDARGAWEHHMAGLVVEESITRHQLREIAVLGDDAPRWMHSRWCADQAYGWMLFSRDPRTDDMVRLVLAAGHLDHVESIAHDPVAFTEYGTLVAGSDWLVKQLCVYEFGGLRDFLDVRARDGLLSRVDRIEEWAAAPLRPHRLEERGGSTLVVRDLVDDESVEVLDLGAFNERPEAAHVLGRVVPISVPPHRMFESRPVSVDRPTANHAAAAIRRGDDLGWLDAVSAAREEGRLDRRFSCRQSTLFSTDLTVEPPSPTGGEPPGRLTELLAAGLDDYVANGVMVAEVAMIAATVSGETAGGAGPHLMTVLVDPRILEAVRAHCTAPEHETAWRVLATVTTSPVSERCRDLADRCRRAA